MWTQAEYDALKAAIAKGVRSVQYGNRAVVYQNLDEMLALLAAMNADLALAAGTGHTYRVAAFSKGLT